ncbi:MAG: hypothetical protein OQJ97_04240 [Rhodospirillales bacterium]|nr:hypothetical protein [Rhodospirillales bacterium]
MSLKSMFKACVSAIPLVLSGCSDGPTVISNFNKGPTIIWDLAVSANLKGPILVEVHGNPFGGGESHLKSVILKDMTDSIEKRKFTYTLEKSKAPSPDFKVTILFGAPNNLNANRVCEGERPEPNYDLEKITVRAVLCSRNDLLSDVEGWVKNVESPDDISFKTLIEIVTRELILLTP